MKTVMAFLALAVGASAQIAGGLTGEADEAQLALFKKLSKMEIKEKYDEHDNTCVLGWPINIFRMSKRYAKEECAADCDENTQCSGFDVCDLADEEVSPGMKEDDFTRWRCVLKHEDHGVEKTGFWMPSAQCPRGCGFGRAKNPCTCDHFSKKEAVHRV